MKKFMDDNFLLSTDTAVTLYHDFAKDMPICDYHCHLNPKEIAEDKRYNNITEIWLGGDHYKWRTMRSFGIEEKYITGDATDYEKFEAFAKVMPYLIGNPMYHWSHLELKRYFGIEETLSPKTCKSIWDRCNEIINGEGFSARAMIKNSNVKYIGTTDDPIDNLEYHIAIAKDENFDYFGTTLTVSPYKNSRLINEIGALLEQNYGVKYLYSDFKKNDGYKKSIELSRTYNLYRQNYCGCLYGRDLDV